MNTAEATFLSALALSSPLWGSVLIGKLIERRKTKREAQEEAAH